MTPTHEARQGLRAKVRDAIYGELTDAQLRTIADQVPDKEAAKVLHLADDLALVTDGKDGGGSNDRLFHGSGISLRGRNRPKQ